MKIVDWTAGAADTNAVLFARLEDDSIWFIGVDEALNPDLEGWKRLPCIPMHGEVIPPTKPTRVRAKKTRITLTA